MSGTDGDRPRVLVDGMLGGIPVYLRICGWNATYTGDLGIERDEVIYRLATMSNRRVISRDRELVQRAVRGWLLTTTDIESQLAELSSAGAILAVADPPARYGRCNGWLVPEPPGLPRPSYASVDTNVPCWRCKRCAQYFWHGSHWERMRRTLDRAVAD